MIRAAGLRWMTTRRRLRSHFACGVLLFGVALETRAADVVAALPHTLHRGPPRGWATTEGVDWTRSYQMRDVLAPRAARALWKAQLTGGVSCNVLVDEEGRVFAAGQGQVTQLDREGAREYSHRTDSPGALAATLLADGARVVLTKDGRVSSWSRRGRAGFSLALAAPPAAAHGSLLPLPEGGALVSIGAWLFELEPSGAIRGRALLKQNVDHTLIANERAVVVDDKGDVMTWNGESFPERRGSFGGRVARVTARGPSSLVGLLPARGLVEVSLSTGDRTQLAGTENVGLLPVLAVSGSESFALMASDGSPFLHSSGAILPAGTSRAGKADLIGDAHLLASADGTLISLGSHTALRLQKGGEVQQVDEVRCAHPVSLVPAGSSRVLAACSSGQLWLIGPAASVTRSSSGPALKQ